MSSEQKTPENTAKTNHSESLDTFKALVENSFDAVVIIADDGTIRYISPSVRYVLGYSAEERIGHDVFENIHPDDRENALAALEDVRAKDNARGYLQLSLKHKDGSWRTVEVMAQNLRTDPVIHGIVANYRDITERIKTQEALRISEERYHKAFSASPDAITINYIDNGRFLEVNRGFERITGYSRDEVIGRAVGEITLWKDPGQRNVMIERLQADGSVMDFEADFVTKDGEDKSCLVSAELIELAGERCMLSVTRDVTLQKEAALELQKASETLRKEHEAVAEKNAALKQVLEHLEQEKATFRKEVSASVQALFNPFIEKLKNGEGTLSPEDTARLEAGLLRITGEVIDDFQTNYARLTSREIDICELITQGLSSKEIADRLGLSPQTVHKHRRMIRRKLQLDHRGVNLAAYLRSR